MPMFAKLSILLRKPFVKLVVKPTPVTYIGPGRTGEIGRMLAMMDVKKPLIITDAVLRKLGLLDGILAGLEQEGIQPVIFSEVLPDPTFAVVAQAQKKLCRL